jgi:hypothetical protein
MWMNHRAIKYFWMTVAILVILGMLGLLFAPLF